MSAVLVWLVAADQYIVFTIWLIKPNYNEQNSQWNPEYRLQTCFSVFILYFKVNDKLKSKQVLLCSTKTAKKVDFTAEIPFCFSLGGSFIHALFWFYEIYLICNHSRFMNFTVFH